MENNISIFDQINPYNGFLKAKAISSGEIIKRVTNSGLRGMGGAGFPTGLKWSMVRSQVSTEKYVVVNIDEGEPGTFKDKLLIEMRPELVICGALIAAHAIGASRVILYIRHEYTDGLAIIKQAIEDTPAEIKRQDMFPRVEAIRGAGGYICGEESALLESIEGYRAEPTIRPPFPAQRGLYSKPTLVNNVETLVNVPLIIEKGAEWFKGNHKKMFCLSGDVNLPGIYEAPPGISLRELVHDFAGGVCDGRNFKLAIVGGYSGNILGAKDLDAKLEYGVMGNGAVIVLNDTRSVLEIARNISNFFREETCGKCAPCRQGTAIVDSILAGNVGIESGAVEAELSTLSTVMKDTSLCGLGQTATRAIDGLMEKFRSEMLHELTAQ